MFLYKFNEIQKIAVIRKEVKCSIPRKHKYNEYIVNAATREEAERIAADGAQIGGAAFCEKYNTSCEPVVE